MTIHSPFTPSIDEVNAPFYEGAANGELCIQRCESCGQHRHPPQQRCPNCHSDKVGWSVPKGSAKIFSFVIAHPPLPAGFAEIAPVPVALVELDDIAGIRLVGTLLDVGDRTPQIGDSVVVVFESVAGGPILPHYRFA